MTPPLASSLFAVMLAALLPLAAQDYEFFTEDFEGIDPPGPNSAGPELGNGMLVGANVFAPDNVYVGGYFSFPAPNVTGDGARFCNIALMQGGPDQGDKVLSVFSDYNNGQAHTLGQLVDANTFVEFVLEEDDLGTTVTFEFDAKFGNFDPTPLTGPAGADPPFTPEAEAFLKVLDPLNDFSVVLDDVEDASAFPVTWGTYTLTISIPNEQVYVGRLLQAGFRNKTSLYHDSTIYYDNLSLTSDRVVPQPGVIPIVDFGLDAGEFFVEFESEDSKDYALERRLPGGDWETVDSILGAFPGTETLYDGDANASQPTAIYRVTEVIE